MKRAGLYVRVSTEDQRIHGMSVDDQVQALQEYCKEHDYQIIGIYNDAGISARKSYRKRPALLRMLEDCQANSLDIVLFTRLDRFSRNVGAFYSIMEQMNGIPWRAIREDYETETPDGVFKVNIMLSIAQAEADKTSTRLKDSYQYRKAKGIYIGRPPIGYLVKDGKLIKDPQTKDGVQAMFDTYLNTLSSARAMEKASEYGLLFNRASFPKVLKNPTYAGVSANGHQCESYITPENHEFICNVKNSRKVKPKYPNMVYIFSGVLVCGYCGRRMVGKQREVTLSTGEKRMYVRYICQGDRSTYNPCTRHFEISANKIENIMLKRLEIEIGHLKHEIRISQGEIAEKIKQKKKLEKKLDRVKEMYIEGDISKDVYKCKKHQIECDMASIIINPIRIPELPQGWKKVYESLTLENKQVFWKKIIDRIIITNETKETPKIFFRC